jgi:membrane-bound lytic murein transglycosylase D
MMKRVLFLRKPLWLVLAILGGYTPAMMGTSKAFPSLSNEIGDYSNFYAASPKDFPRPPEINDAVTFWRHVFGDWRAHQIVLHDDKYLGVIYKTIEIKGYIGGRLSAEQQALVDKNKKQLIGQLNDIEYRVHKRMGLSDEQQKLYRLLTTNAGRKALKHASERVRIQRGMKESFLIGLKESNRYTEGMRKVFQEQHLPPELVYLPHVESAFTTSARSPAGAIGVWQFMPVTGKRYLRMDSSIDERFDPILATSGAAKYLAYAFNKLGDWGLAVSSYNHGLSGMLRARQEYGKDIVRIIDQYDGASFGFASRNYYAEFLAVCDIMANLTHFFPKGIDYQQPIPLKRIEIAEKMTSGEIAKRYRIHYKKLAEVNPAWTKIAAEGKVALPANSTVWLPKIIPVEKPAQITAKAKQSTDEKNQTLLAGNYLSYKNPSFWNILEEFPEGLSGRLLADASLSPNRKLIKNKSSAKKNRVILKVPEIHIVQTGDSPYTIATKYSVHLKELLALNEISAGTLIQPGQPIRIPENKNG